MNDYTINGSIPGSTSCPVLCFPAPATLTLNVSTAPGNGVLIIWSTCPCRPCAIPWPPNACVPTIPSTVSCFGFTTNQSVDLPLVAGCSIVLTSFLFANAAGNATQTITVPSFSLPPCGATFSTQAVVFDVCGLGGPPVGPGPFVMTQGYTVNF